MTCDNTASRCDLAYATMYYRVDPVSVPTIIANDLASTILPAFRQVNGGPQLVTCVGPCTEDVTIYPEPVNGPHLLGAGDRTFQK